ncbi:hypothetical protein HTG_18810 [Natrinema mahii]|nr:hypothetical protein HTG_18810 [Natrinema mahii]
MLLGCTTKPFGNNCSLDEKRDCKADNTAKYTDIDEE